MEILENQYILLTLTFGVFFIARIIQRMTHQIWLNPILITIAFMIVFLSVTGISYDTYSQAGAKIEFWLKPAVVALGVPLYRQMRSIRQQFVPILMSQLVGCVVGITYHYGYVVRIYRSRRYSVCLYGNHQLLRIHT